MALSEGQSYHTNGVTVTRVGDSLRVTRTDVAGGSVHIPVDDVDDIAAAMQALAE